MEIELLAINIDFLLSKAVSTSSKNGKTLIHTSLSVALKNFSQNPLTLKNSLVSDFGNNFSNLEKRFFILISSTEQKAQLNSAFPPLAQFSLTFINKSVFILALFLLALVVKNSFRKKGVKNSLVAAGASFADLKDRLKGRS